MPAGFRASSNSRPPNCGSKFDKLRDAIEHNGLVGEEGEKIVAAFLRERLPGSIGVTTGEVLDVEGGRSRQTDVVLYDALRTPMLFTGEEKDAHVVPAEGVLAVIEVKKRLGSSAAQCTRWLALFGGRSGPGS